MEPCTRISLWASPRNISTAMMYSFAQRDDCTVVDEPLYGYYLKNSSAREYHPAADEIMKILPTEGKEVIESILQEFPKPLIFFKNMSHHLLNLDRAFLDEMKHIILTRHPKDMLLSFSKVIHQPKMEDVGYASQLNLLNELHSRDLPIAVIDAKFILEDSKNALRKLCDFLQIDFQPSMLQWAAGARKEDGVWAKYWYENVHRSTGFEKYQPKNEELPKSLEILYHQCLDHYDQLLQFHI